MAVVAIAAGISAYNANTTKQTKFSDLQMENLEALADGNEAINGSCVGDHHGCPVEPHVGYFYIYRR